MAVCRVERGVITFYENASSVGGKIKNTVHQLPCGKWILRYLDGKNVVDEIEFIPTAKFKSIVSWTCFEY